MLHLCWNYAAGLMPLTSFSLCFEWLFIVGRDVVAIATTDQSKGMIHLLSPRLSP